MFHPGPLEASLLVALVALAGEGLVLAWKRPALRPIAAGLVMQAGVEVGRLWTRGTAIDRILFVAWAGLAAAPAVAVLGSWHGKGAPARPPTSARAGARLDRTPLFLGRWLAFGAIVLAFVLLGLAVAWISPAFRRPALLPYWPRVLEASRLLAVTLVVYALVERGLRSGGRWVDLRREEQAALLLPASQLVDLAAVWMLGPGWPVARILAFVTYGALAAMLWSCRSTAATSSPSPSA